MRTSIRKDFLGEAHLEELIRSCRLKIKTATEALENEQAIRTILSSADPKSGKLSSSSNTVRLFEQWMLLAKLLNADRASLEDSLEAYRRAATISYRCHTLCDFSVSRSGTQVISVYGAQAKAYENRTDAEILGPVAGNPGWKHVRIGYVWNPLDSIASPGILAAILALDWKLAAEIAVLTPVKGIEAAIALNRDDLLAELTKGFNPKKPADADWPGGRHQFPWGLVRNDDALLKAGIADVSRAFSKRWKMSRYTTPTMVERLGSAEQAVEAARVFLVDMRWLLYEFGLMHCVAAIRRGRTTLLNEETQWSEWLPREWVEAAR